MTDETTTEQLAEIEAQPESTPVTGYTPPEGWRVLQVGEVLQPGDVWVNHEGEPWPTKRVGETVNDERYIRPIEPQPQAEPVPEPQLEPVQVREGRWRTRNGLVKSVTAMPTDHEDFAAAYPWWDGVSTWRNDGRWLAGGSTMDLVEYLGPIEQQPEPQPVQGGLVRDVTHLLEESGVLDSAKAEQQIEELRSEVSYVQNLLGTERRRVTELEELVVSLRTINEAQEKAVEAAGKQNDALRVQVRILQREADKKNSRIEFLETLDAGNAVAICDYRAKVEKLQGLVDTARGQLETAATEHDSLSTQLAAVKAELATVAADRQRLQIELDAAQQVPADSLELRQLRANLEQMTLGRDTYRDGYERVLSDLETARETAKAEAVEAIVEWLEPIRRANTTLRAAILFHLPSIMRSIAGLDSHAID